MTETNDNVMLCSICGETTYVRENIVSAEEFFKGINWSEEDIDKALIAKDLDELFACKRCETLYRLIYYASKEDFNIVPTLVRKVQLTLQKKQRAKARKLMAFLSSNIGTFNRFAYKTKDAIVEVLISNWDEIRDIINGSEGDDG